MSDDDNIIVASCWDSNGYIGVTLLEDNVFETAMMIESNKENEGQQC